MYQKANLRIAMAVLLFWGLILFTPFSEAAEKKPLTFQDVMKFKEIRNPVISENGLWITYTAQPDRGDGEVIIHSIKKGKVFTVKRGSNPVISKNSRWVAMIVKPEAVELEKTKKKKPKQGMALLETLTGEVVHFKKVERFKFSENSMWLAYSHFKEEEKPKKEEKTQKEEKGEAPEKEEVTKKAKKVGTTLVLRHLESGKEIQISYVLSSAFDSASGYLAYALAGPEGKNNGLYYVELEKESCQQKAIEKIENGLYSNLTWAKEESKLAFLSSTKEKKNDEESGFYSLCIWNSKTGKTIQAVSAEDTPEGWIIPEKNRISWTRDGKRIFFGFKPKEFFDVGEKTKKKEKEEEKIDLFSIEKILEKRGVDVWHWNDPLIIPNQKKMWPRFKDQTYLAVFHLDSKQTILLADREMPRVQISENPNFALGISDIPYRKEITWYGRLNDIFLVNLKDGSRKKVASFLEDRFSLSPGGRYVVYYKDKHWFLFDGKTGALKNLTSQLKIPFFNEDHDYPRKVPGYGYAGWVKDDKAVLIYDKYDIWEFSTKTGKVLNITAGKGRKNNITFRVLRLDREKLFFDEKQKILLSAYNNLEKHTLFSACRVGSSGVEKRIEEKKRFRFLAKAKKADVLMFTRESYQEFPDIWISDLKFTSPKKVTNVNPQISDFAWGSAELVEWNSLDGIPLQGVLIKPGNYEPGKRYPVIVYFYRFFSQRLHEFNQIVVNHRPCFPYYASNGYALFLPDIRFDVGHPGYSATKCLVPGVQKLIDMGIADPKGIGLHGHSWSGYQAAFVITQTDIFTCTIAGAPVSNMTSAYSGIRWGSGLARQFQYEMAQSRIGGSLWEYPERYIENSPVFFTDRIHTPLLIQFGDEDGAVPWYQGIELYLAMRRLGKDCIFLQYRGEPHHLQKYSNKLDYSIKMKQYFDHYLKGKPAPKWILEGIPYRGK
ncbi:MAG: S9 family peptidase [Candidatus Aminicenantes bacterium]|nr:S9 family peptidase [Candidatus Aminicenantes bacterium]